ncbi:hypothetical protein [Microbacterium sp. CFBP9034]|uniref:hypothetical protein n=1 Tax=Microbacterium sp. CFBP9034 TaxID=3096540 RepID=UPI002A69FB67|nr:hypothetical protein [Microbacterium sp. CFBP9034]MDY0910890.1 hypothetical protein [Microbacterium sp. CFBP9034]
MRAGVGTLIIAGALAMGGFALPAHAASFPADSVGATPSPSPTTNPVCEVVDAIIAAESDDGIRIANELLSQGRDVEDVAAAITRCLTVAPQKLTGAQSTEAVCAIAGELNADKKFDDAVVLIEAAREAKDSTDLCEDEFDAAVAGGATASTPEGFGGLWTEFQKSVLTPLSSVAGFVGLSTLVLVALGRLLALLPPFRDWKWRGQRRAVRRIAGAIGLVLALAVPSAVALRGMWLMRTQGPAGTSLAETTPFYPDFVALVAANGWPWWWWLVVPAVLSVALLAFAFGSRQRVTVTIKPKEDGTGLDSTRLMAAIHAMAGRGARGLEFPVGTDLASASAAVTEISSNKAVAAVQAVVKAIFAASPWEMKVESETADAASIAISRNGVLLAARRMRIDEGHPLHGISESSRADQLAALAAGELIAALRLRYRAEFDPYLHGATQGSSIGLQFVASSTLAGTRELRKKAVPLLRRALDDDPANRAAWVTLANFLYRDPELTPIGDATPHIVYRESLITAIDEEVRRARRATPVEVWLRTVTSQDGLYARIGDRAQRARRSALRRNTLLTRLLQTYSAASANLRALVHAGQSVPAHLSPPPLADDPGRWLRLYLAIGERQDGTPASIRRRQLLLIDELRATPWTEEEAAGAIPPILERREYAGEREAWRGVAAPLAPAGAFPAEDGSVASGGGTAEEASGTTAGPMADDEAGTSSGSVTGNASRPADDLATRFRREDAALAVSSDVMRDAGIAYSLACYRSEAYMPLPGPPPVGQAPVPAVVVEGPPVVPPPSGLAALGAWIAGLFVDPPAVPPVTTPAAPVSGGATPAGPDPAAVAEMRLLLTVAAQQAAVREWYPVDPEMARVRGTDIEPDAMTAPEPEEPEEEASADDSELVALVKAALARIADL